MARLGRVTAGSFAGAVSQAIWTEITDVLIPQMTTYTGQNTVRVPMDAGKWEGHIVSNTYNHLRIDYQGPTEPRGVNDVTWEAGSNASPRDQQLKYANWQIQFGPHKADRATFSAKKTLTGDSLQKSKGSIAGIRMAFDNDFTINDIQEAFLLSYQHSARTGNVFAVLLPTGPYVAAVAEADQNWIINLQCSRCKGGKADPFKVIFSSKDGQFATKSFTSVYMNNALPHTACPECKRSYVLSLSGHSPIVKPGDDDNVSYEFEIVSHTIKKIGKK